MDILPLLLPLFGITAFLSLLWLSIHAFKKHLGWGFLVLLFSPIGASIFGISYWDEEKKPFLAYLTTFLVSVSLALYLFTTWGGWEMLRAGYRVQQGIQTQTLSQEDASIYMHTSLDFIEKSGLASANQQQLDTAREQLNQLEEPQTPEAAPGAPEADEVPAREEISHKTISKKAPPPPHYRLEYMTIDVDDAKNYVGYTVKVTRRGVPEKEYRLTKARGNRIYLSQRNGYGSYSFSYRTHDIEKIRVLTKKYD